MVLAALLAAGCSSRPQHPIPYIPPQTQYSTGSTLMAAGGLMAAAVGSSLNDARAPSRTQRAIGTGAMAAGLGMVAASMIDAIEVQGARKAFIDITRAFYHQYYGGSLPESGEKPAPAPIPEIPFQFKDEGTPEDP